MNPVQKLIVRALEEEDLDLGQIGAALNMLPKRVTYHVNKLIDARIVKHVGWKTRKQGLPFKVFSLKTVKQKAEPYQALSQNERPRRYKDKYRGLIRLRERARRAAKKHLTE